MPNNHRNEKLRENNEHRADGMNEKKRTPSDDPKAGGGIASGKQSSPGGHQGSGKKGTPSK